MLMDDGGACGAVPSVVSVTWSVVVVELVMDGGALSFVLRLCESP